MRHKRVAFLWLSGMAGAMSVLTTLAFSQVPAPIPSLPTDATKDVQSTIQNTTNAAQDAAKDATKKTQDATKSATDATRDLQKSTTDAAQDATKRAQDTTRDATKRVQDTTRDATNRAQDATRDAAKRAQDATKDATDATRNRQQDAARDATRAPSDDQQRDQRSDPSLRARGSLSANATTEFRGADLGVWFDRSATNGLIIADIAADAALGRFGFLSGDRIVSIGGQNVTTEADFTRYLLDANARDRLDVIVMRGGRQQTLYVEPTGLREQISSISVDPLEQFGVILDDRYSDRLVVWRVVPRSPAFYAGIRPSDVLVMFGGRRINNPRALAQIVEQTQPGNVSLQVARNGRTRVIEADFPQLQISRSHTTFRQNLDVDAGIRSNADSSIRARADANADVQVGDAPAYRNYSTDRNYSQPRRGLFRRR